MTDRDNPIYHLAQQVWAGQINLQEACTRVTTPAQLALVDDDRLHVLNLTVHDMAKQDPSRSIVLAVINCCAAKHKASDVIWGNCNKTLGWLYLQQDMLDLAQHHYQVALKAFESIPRARPAITQIRLALGELGERRGDFPAALAAYRSALALARQIPRPKFESDARNYIGNVYLLQGKIDQAILEFEQALQISTAHDDGRGQAVSFGNLGQANRALGRSGHFGHKQKQQFQAVVVQNRSTPEVSLPDNATAIDYYLHAINLSQAEHHQAGWGRHLSNLGGALLDLGRLDEAETCYKKALPIARQNFDRRAEQKRLNNLGNIYDARSRREQNPANRGQWLHRAWRSYNDALQLAADRKDRRGQSETVTNLGRIAGKLADFESAQKNYEQALALVESLDAVDVQWRIKYNFGNLLVEQQQYRQAFEHYEAAIQLVQDQRSRLNIESRGQFWQDRSALYYRMVHCCLRLQKWRPALDYLEQAKARHLTDRLLLTNLLSTDEAGLSVLSPSQQQALKQAQQEIAKLKAERQLSPENPHRRADAELDRLLEQTQTDLVRLWPTTLDMAQFLSLAPLNGALVELLVTEQGTVIFVIPYGTRTIGPEHVVQLNNFTTETLKGLLMGSREQPGWLRAYAVYTNKRDQETNQVEDVIDGWTSAIEKFTAQLWTSLMAAIHSKLHAFGLTDGAPVTLLPQGWLNLLPLHAAWRNVEGRVQYFLDDFTVNYASSAYALWVSQYRAGQKHRHGSSLATLVNPTGDLKFTPLEAEAIAALFDHPHLLTGADVAPETTVKAVVGKNYVHYAGHGVADWQDPFASYLSMANDHHFSLTEIIKLDLNAARLVSLSACETGQIDFLQTPDESVGLQTGFLQAGAAGVISTLWRVAELPTVLLMQQFYQFHRVEDFPPPVALRKAQTWLRHRLTLGEIVAYIEKAQQYAEDTGQWYWLGKLGRQKNYLLTKHGPNPEAQPFNAPYYWAAFVLAGV